MNNICPLCRTEYIPKKYHKSNLCNECYKEKRKLYWKEWKRTKRYNQKPIFDKVNINIRPYIFNLVESGYNVIDASGSSIILNGIFIFDIIAEGWSQNIINNITVLASNGSKKSWIKFGSWVYYDLKFRNINEFAVDIKKIL
jgi:hypothetical protein